MDGDSITDFFFLLSAIVCFFVFPCPVRSSPSFSFSFANLSLSIVTLHPWSFHPAALLVDWGLDIFNGTSPQPPPCSCSFNSSCQRRAPCPLCLPRRLTLHRLCPASGLLPDSRLPSMDKAGSPRLNVVRFPAQRWVFRGELQTVFREAKRLAANSRRRCWTYRRRSTVFLIAPSSRFLMVAGVSEGHRR